MTEPPSQKHGGFFIYETTKKHNRIRKHRGSPGSGALLKNLGGWGTTPYGIDIDKRIEGIGWRCINSQFMKFKEVLNELNPDLRRVRGKPASRRNPSDNLIISSVYSCVFASIRG